MKLYIYIYIYIYIYNSKQNKKQIKKMITKFERLKKLKMVKFKKKNFIDYSKEKILIKRTKTKCQGKRN